MEVDLDTKPPTVERVVEKEDVEQAQQVQHGDQTLLERFIRLPSAMFFVIIVQASWETFAFAFQFALFNGGPASIVYGGILALIGGTAVAASLAEMASIDAVVGAQYRWSANFAPSAPRFWGLMQGWITTAAWIFATASGPAILATVVTGLIIFNDESYTPKRWHTTLLMWLFTLLPSIFNLWFRRILATLEMIGGICHVVFFIASIATLTALATRSTDEWVFGTLTNNVSGWTNPAVAWGIGLLTVAWPVSSADGLLHMSAEVKRVRVNVPYSILVSTFVNAVMQFAFAICLLYTIGDVDKVTNSPTGLPLIEIYYGATGSKAATNVFIVALGFVIFIAVFNCFASVSRLTWSFARDHGLPFREVFSKVHPTYKMPINALVLITVICFLLALIYIASSTAYNGIISLVTISLHVSYFIPILFLLIKRVRGQTISYGPFNLGRWGIATNLISLVYLLFVIIWMPFPTIRPVTAQNMNYAGPALLIIIIGALSDWFISGHKRFKVPVLRDEPDF